MLIGLHGPAKSGKDTAFHLLRQELYPDGCKIERKSFAELLKASAAVTLGFPLGDPVVQMEDFKQSGKVLVTLNKRTWEVSGRRYLQWYGTDAHRAIFGDDFWVDRCLPLDSNHEGEIWIVTDVRFKNEAARIRELGGEVWKINRDVEGIENHASEIPLPDDMIDWTVENNGTKEEFLGELMLAYAGTPLQRRYHEVEA